MAWVSTWRMARNSKKCLTSKEIFCIIHLSILLRDSTLKLWSFLKLSKILFCFFQFSKTSLLAFLDFSFATPSPFSLTKSLAASLSASDGGGFFISSFSNFSASLSRVVTWNISPAPPQPLVVIIGVWM